MNPRSPDSRKDAADRLLRRLGVAIKTFALYPQQHPACVHALQMLNLILRPYLESYGSFSVHISKHALSADGANFNDETLASLALQLYTRKLAQFTILPAVSDQELASFLAVVGTDRITLEGAGGVEHLLWQAEVGNVQVVEITLEEDQEVDTLGLSAFFALIGRGRLAPREREAVLDILHAPDETAGLLRNVYALTADVFEGIEPGDRVTHTYEAVRTLDRLILDEPPEDQPPLWTNLAAAVASLEEPLRAAVARRMLAGAGEDATTAVILRHLSGEQLAQMLGGIQPPDDLTRQVAAAVQVLTPGDPTLELIALLEERLRPAGASSSWLRDAIGPELNGAAAGEPEVPPEFIVDDSQIAISHDELEQRLKEAKAVDEPDAVREVIRTLVDLLRHETDEEELVEVADALTSHLDWMLDHQEFALLARILAGVREVAATTAGSRHTLALSILQRLAQHPLLDRLLTALWAGRDTPVEREVQECLAVLADEVTVPLVRVLGGEPRSGMRALLCDLLVSIARDKVEELAEFAGDERWYLVRNIANILGRLQNPAVVPHLGRLVNHPEYRVRREVVDALARVGTAEAQDLLVRLLDDLDARVQLRAIHALNAAGARRALPKLVAFLEARDPLQRLFEVKQAALEAVERVGAREALPILQRLARSPIVLGRRGRELREAARRAVAALEGRSGDQVPRRVDRAPAVHGS